MVVRPAQALTQFIDLNTCVLDGDETVRPNLQMHRAVQSDDHAATSDARPFRMRHLAIVVRGQPCCMGIVQADQSTFYSFASESMNCAPGSASARFR